MRQEIFPTTCPETSVTDYESTVRNISEERRSYWISSLSRRMNVPPPHGAAAQRESWPPHSWGFLTIHNAASQSVGLLWTSDQLVAETSTWQHTAQQTSMPPVGFEPTISAGERPQTYALDARPLGPAPNKYVRFAALLDSFVLWPSVALCSSSHVKLSIIESP